jgi:Zn-dependent protease
MTRCYAARVTIDFMLGTVPVRVQPWFFLTALLIGPHDLGGMVLWVPLVFIGVLAHELGHAAAIRRLGVRPAIELHGFGGVTSWLGRRSVTPAQRAVVSAAGPAVGVTIGVACLLIFHAIQPASVPAARLLQYAVWVNLGWGLLNLLPVLPLDGGAIVGSFAEMLWGERGLRSARLLSIIACVVLGGAALAAGWLWSAIIAAILALTNVQALRQSEPSDSAQR